MSKVYEMIQKRIINSVMQQLEDMKKDPSLTFHWVKPWNGTRPFNDVTGKYYTGINLLLLERSGAYLTWNQIQDRKLRVRKGAKAVPVVFWKITEKESDADMSEEDEGNKIKKYFVLRYYNVYHESDIVDFKRKHHVEDLSVEHTPEEDQKLLYSVLKSYCSSEEIPFIEEESDRAYYIPSKDEVHIPSSRQFKNYNEFLSTGAHECVHSTGAESRLNRDIKNVFGDHSYSKEELVAEIGADMLLGTYYIEDDDTYRNSVSYVRGWLSKLDEEPTYLVSAAQKAQKAVDYIIQYDPTALESDMTTSDLGADISDIKGF